MQMKQVMNRQFELKSKFEPAGDQPTAIKQLIEGIDAGLAAQTLLGVQARVKPTLSLK